MKKILIVIIATILGISVISGISLYFSYNNHEISLRNEAEAQRGKIEGLHDKTRRITRQDTKDYMTEHEGLHERTQRIA